MAMKPSSKKSRTTKPRETTSDRILDCAEFLVQTRGFSGFSYADIAAQLRITNASVHHHFATKAHLGRQLIQRYHEGFRAALDRIDARGNDARKRLQAYVKLYRDVLRDRERMCLCGMLAADFTVLSPPLRRSLRAFFEMNEEWITQVLTEGQSKRSFHLIRPPRDEARRLLAALEGAMLVARCFGDVARFRSAAEGLLAGLTA